MQRTFSVCNTYVSYNSAIVDADELVVWPFTKFYFHLCTKFSKPCFYAICCTRMNSARFSHIFDVLNKNVTMNHGWYCQQFRVRDTYYIRKCTFSHYRSNYQGELKCSFSQDNWFKMYVQREWSDILLIHHWLFSQPYGRQSHGHIKYLHSAVTQQLNKILSSIYSAPIYTNGT